MTEPQGEKRNSLGAEQKRYSIQMKSSIVSEGKIGIKQILTAPSQSHSRMTPGGQMFLCVMGSVISFAICIWLAAFSREPGWRRVIFSGGAAVCAIMFALLALMTMRRAKHPQEPEPLPDLSHRRSTIGAARVAGKRSIAAGATGDDCPSQVLVVGDKTRPSLTVG